MKVRGYMIEVEYDGQTLRVEPTNKSARVALFGAELLEGREGPLEVPGDQIVTVELEKANPIVNGNLVVTTTDGRKYQLHYRRKQSAEFAQLADALQA